VIHQVRRKVCNFQNANRGNFENGPQLQREEAKWKIPMLKLLAQLQNEFLRLGSCYSPVIPTTIIDPSPACKSTGRSNAVLGGSHTFEKGPVLMVKSF
jgi:hypothetical protein